ncbi:MAG: hypothetical protein ACLFQY_21250 [Desulfococcaceae bacterium]
MKFSDLFVPRYMHSVPDVRIKAVGKLKDGKLLSQIAEKDENEKVRRQAAERLNDLKDMRGIA